MAAMMNSGYTAADPATSKQGTIVAGLTEDVLHTGFDGKTNEYCPYTETSKCYDNTRAPLGVHIALGTMSMSDVPLTAQRVLDIGCGTGTFIEQVMGKVGDLTGVEYNDGMIEQAKARVGDKVALIQGSADELPFEDETFHACTVNQVIHHFPKDENYSFAKRSFAEAYRVLKPGGWLILNTSTPEQQRDAFWWLSLFPKASATVCERFPPLDVVKSHLQQVGFRYTADSVTVPTQRTLMAEDKYLKDGVHAGFSAAYRAGDSSWSMAENSGELESGLKNLQDMIDNGTAEDWLAKREALRLSMGQATFISVQKAMI